MIWEEYLSKLIETFRSDFEKLSDSTQYMIRNELLDISLLKPCQIEVLDSVGEKRVVWLVVHDNNLSDMMFVIRKNVKSVNSSEFVKDYSFFNRAEIDKRFKLASYREFGHIDVFMKGRSITYLYRETSPESIGADMLESLVRRVQGKIRAKQLATIKQITEKLRKQAGKVTEKAIETNLTKYTEKIEGALAEIKRMDKEIGGIREVMGISKEYQDWRLLVSDVHRLKEEHVPREVFIAKVSELSTRIDALAGIKEAYDKILAQQSSFINWIKYSAVFVPIAIACVPIVQTLIQHLLGK
jgi:acetolactate synthase small subunit